MLFYTRYLIPCIKVLCLSRGCQIRQETRKRGNYKNCHVKILIKERHTSIYSDGVPLHVFIPLFCEQIFIVVYQRLKTVQSIITELEKFDFNNTYKLK